ncbi:tripartite motif-containing protein 2-like [Branchiostoma floridae]|uniref:RING-type E3 ubiquitin transferase n=1 Tax=Branchiostoma floridae TaxID=7739 RepID=A0A9J7MVQ0_BRAFL|nr:tripartite motif-containing protein 2-like [Branchiostoma floridae]
MARSPKGSPQESKMAALTAPSPTGTSTVLNKISDEMIVCNICFETYNRPKVLPCLHTFCMDCLARLTASKTAKSPKGKLTCPMCREETPLPKNGVKGLRDNFFVSNLCQILHAERERTRNAPRPRSPAPPRREKKEVTCGTHDGEVIKYFCDKCEVPICGDCFVMEHNGHTVSKLKDAASKYCERIRERVGECRERAKPLQQAVSLLVAMENELKQNKETTKEEIHQHAEMLIEAIQQNEEEMVSAVEAIYNDRKDSLANQRGEMQAGLHKLEECMQAAEEALEKDSDVEKLSQWSILENSISEAGDLLPTQGPDVNTCVKFSAEHLHENFRLGVLITESVFQFGAKGTKDGEFDSPFRVVTNSQGEILVADNGNKRLQMFDSKGTFKWKSEKEEGDKFLKPVDVAVTPDGNIYITDVANKCVKKFDPKGEVISKFGNDVLDIPSGIAYDARTDHVLVTDAGKNRITIHSSDGELLHHFGSTGDDDSNFNRPIFVAVNSHSDIIVSDYKNHCVKVFDSEGLFLFKFGGEVGADADRGKHGMPAGLCVDPRDNIIVADIHNGRVDLFRPDGSFLRHIATASDGLLSPYGVAMTPDGRVVVTDVSDCAIKIYKY